MYVVVVSFRVREAMVDEAAAELARNARASLTEPGCTTFTVLRDRDDELSFLLYECYRDERAFVAEHRATAHYARWKSVERRCVIEGSRSLRILQSVHETSSRSADDRDHQPSD